MSYKIAVDFDGTCVTHAFPEMGEGIGAVPVLKEIVDAGHKIILFTMRSEDYLSDAVKWFSENEIELYGINQDPAQKSWTSSPKAYAKLYIDDAALGCPLIYPNVGRPFVDWVAVRNFLVSRGILTE